MDAAATYLEPWKWAASPGKRFVRHPGLLDLIALSDDVNLMRAHDEDIYWLTDADRDFVVACDRETVLELIRQLEAAHAHIRGLESEARS